MRGRVTNEKLAWVSPDSTVRQVSGWKNSFTGSREWLASSGGHTNSIPDAGLARDPHTPSNRVQVDDYGVGPEGRGPLRRQRHLEAPRCPFLEIPSALLNMYLRSAQRSTHGQSENAPTSPTSDLGSSFQSPHQRHLCPNLASDSQFGYEQSHGQSQHHTHPGPGDQQLPRPDPLRPSTDESAADYYDLDQLFDFEAFDADNGVSATHVADLGAAPGTTTQDHSSAQPTPLNSMVTSSSTVAKSSSDQQRGVTTEYGATTSYDRAQSSRYAMTQTNMTAPPTQVRAPVEQVQPGVSPAPGPIWTTSHAGHQHLGAQRTNPSLHAQHVPFSQIFHEFDPVEWAAISHTIGLSPQPTPVLHKKRWFYLPRQRDFSQWYPDDQDRFALRVARYGLTIDWNRLDGYWNWYRQNRAAHAPQVQQQLRPQTIPARESFRQPTASGSGQQRQDPSARIATAQELEPGQRQPRPASAASSMSTQSITDEQNADEDHALAQGVDLMVDGYTDAGATPAESSRGSPNQLALETLPSEAKTPNVKWTRGTESTLSQELAIEMDDLLEHFLSKESHE
ncbi:hypothetical protein E8E11_002393 [Didymella keratinophila]|nr:hypothetical protein E8E11_002393 [Didymella keratinophila]